MAAPSAAMSAGRSSPSMRLRMEMAAPESAIVSFPDFVGTVKSPTRR